MTVTADRAAAGRSGARASGRGPARAAAAEPLSRADRVARGKDARAAAPLEAHAEFAARRIAGSGRAAAGPGGVAGAGAGAGAPRADAGVAVHLLPRRGAPDGGGPRHARPPRGCGSSCAGTRTCRTSARSRRRNGGWSSTSTTSTRPCPGPFEWDVKRLAASFAVAGRDNGFPTKSARKIALAAARATARRCAASPRSATLISGTRAWTSKPAFARDPGSDHREEAQARRRAAGEGPHPGQHAGVRKLTRSSTASRGSSATRHVVPVEEIFADVQADARYEQFCAGPGQIPAHPVVRPPPPARAVHAGPGGPQGRRGRQRRHPRVGVAHGRRGRQRAAVPAGQGSPALGAGRYCGQSRYNNQGERVVEGSA